MSSLGEKPSFDGYVQNLEKKERDVLNEDDVSDVLPEEAKRIMWKIDRRLIVTTRLCYCISLMDRGNLGVAVVAG